MKSYFNGGIHIHTAMLFCWMLLLLTPLNAIGVTSHSLRGRASYTSAFLTNPSQYSTSASRQSPGCNSISSPLPTDAVPINGDALVVCNWKCYTSSKDARHHIDRFARLKLPSNVKVITAPSRVFLGDMVNTYKELQSDCIPCSQDVSAASPSFGPFTGEVTAGMLKDIGVNWTIIGHSERRECGIAGIAETRQLVNRKLRSSLDKGLNAIVCVGETRGGNMAEVVQQLQDTFEGIEDVSERVLIAYEPSKSVGTDKPVLPEEANAVIQYIKDHTGGRFDGYRFLYGGSVSHSGASSYVKQPNIAGIMVGRIWQDGEFEKTLYSINTA